MTPVAKVHNLIAVVLIMLRLDSGLVRPYMKYFGACSNHSLLMDAAIPDASCLPVATS